MVIAEMKNNLNLKKRANISLKICGTFFCNEIWTFILNNTMKSRNSRNVNCMLMKKTKKWEKYINIFNRRNVFFNIFFEKNW